ncbi:MAG: signal peptidase I [Acidimicrobiales bacterium]
MSDALTVAVTPEPPESPAPMAPKKSSGVRSVIEWGVILVVALLGALIIRTVLFQAFYIPSASMEPTLQLHDRILVNKLSYDLHPVHRGDIVVFKRSALKGISGPVNDLVKRVIGLPGDTLKSTLDGHVLVNGTLLKEPYLARGTPTYNLTEIKIPPHHYFVMGDNRTDSADSRVFGPIDKSLIVGRAFILIWPLNRLGFL